MLRELSCPECQAGVCFCGHCDAEHSLAGCHWCGCGRAVCLRCAALPEGTFCSQRCADAKNIPSKELAVTGRPLKTAAEKLARRRSPFSVRLSLEKRELLRQLAERLECSQGEVVSRGLELVLASWSAEADRD